MIYVLPSDLYKDWKDLMFATELSKNIVKELKESMKGGAGKDDRQTERVNRQ